MILSVCQANHFFAALSVGFDQIQRSSQARAGTLLGMRHYSILLKPYFIYHSVVLKSFNIAISNLPFGRSLTISIRSLTEEYGIIVDIT